MTAADWTLAVLGGLVLYAALVLGSARVCGTNSRTEQPVYPPAVPEPVRRITEPLPPVPPTDAEWDSFLRLINEEAA